MSPPTLLPVRYCAMRSSKYRDSRGHYLPWRRNLGEGHGSRPDDQRSILEKEYDAVCWMEQRKLPLAAESYRQAKDRITAALDRLDYEGRPDETGCA